MKVLGRSDYSLVNEHFSGHRSMHVLLVYIWDCRIEDTRLVIYNFKKTEPNHSVKVVRSIKL